MYSYSEPGSRPPTWDTNQKGTVVLDYYDGFYNSDDNFTYYPLIIFGLLEYIFVSLSLALVIAAYFPVVHNQIVSKATRLEHHSLYWGTAVVSNIFTYGLLFAAGRTWSIIYTFLEMPWSFASRVIIVLCTQEVVVHVILFVSSLIASLRSKNDKYTIPSPKGMAKILINISFCWSCFCCCVCCSPRCRAKTMKVLVLYSFMNFVYHNIMDVISVVFIKFLDASIAFFLIMYISLLVCFLFFVSYLLFIAFHYGKLSVYRQIIICCGSTCMLAICFSALTFIVVMYMLLYIMILTPSGLTGILAGLLPSVGVSIASCYIKKKILITRQSSSKTPAAAVQLEYGTTSEPVNDGEENSAGGTGDGDEYQKLMP